MITLRNITSVVSSYELRSTSQRVTTALNIRDHHHHHHHHRHHHDASFLNRPSCKRHRNHENLRVFDPRGEKRSERRPALSRCWWNDRMRAFTVLRLRDRRSRWQLADSSVRWREGGEGGRGWSMIMIPSNVIDTVGGSTSCAAD